MPMDPPGDATASGTTVAARRNAVGHRSGGGGGSGFGFGRWRGQSSGQRSLGEALHADGVAPEGAQVDAPVARRDRNRRDIWTVTSSTISPTTCDFMR